jgi:hypothetical protein
MGGGLGLPARTTALIFVLNISGMRLSTTSFALLLLPWAARAADLQTLVDRSPFGQAPRADITVAPEQSQLEFRGYVREGGALRFSVFDLSANRGYWIAEGESDQPISVRAFDAAASSLQVDHQGRPITLTLKQSSIQSSAPGVTNVPMPRGMDPNNLTDSDSARRMEAVAAEVRRRRALRAGQRGGVPVKPSVTDTVVAPESAPPAPLPPQ